LSGPLIATTYDSGFAGAHDTYNGIAAGLDGCIYYVLSSAAVDIGAQLYRYDPAPDAITHCGDLTEACGEKTLRTIVQGKCHTVPLESAGRLYLGTHCGYYDIVDGTERMGHPPEGYRPYPGGHFLAYEIGVRGWDDLGIAPEREAILAMTIDPRRRRLYALSWPRALFLICDVGRRTVRSLGPVTPENESGEAPYGAICRSLALDPDNGSVYFTNARGDILRYRTETDQIDRVAGDDLRKDYFGAYSPNAPGHMGYHWRQTFWYGPERVIYGVHGNSGYLFRFDPRAERVEVLERLASRPSQRSGMYDQFSYGYLGFTLGPDGRTIYYLTGAPVYEDGRRVTGKAATAKGESKGVENLHLVTYDIPKQEYRDHGPIHLDNGQRPSYVNSIAVGKDGAVYAISRIVDEGRSDLIRVPPEPTA
jgi:hypothetical protein